MASGYQIATLWPEGPLTFLERLCLTSFLDAGHDVALYHYGPVTGVPEGVALMDAGSVLPHDALPRGTTPRVRALQGDLFRYHALAGGDRLIFVEPDTYCMRRFEPQSGHFHGWESDTAINSGILALPPDSPTLGLLLDFTRDEYAVAP